MTRFAARKADRSDTVSCNGVNHTDRGRRGSCLQCGRDVIKREDGRLYNIQHATSESGYERTFYRCYDRTHRCDPALTELYQAAHRRDLDAGLIVHDQRVTVIRGRKVPKGTAGTVFYVALAEGYTGEEYTRVGFRTDGGESFFVTAEYLKAAPKS